MVNRIIYANIKINIVETNVKNNYVDDNVVHGVGDDSTLDFNHILSTLTYVDMDLMQSHILHI